jgi:hypothetical protein
MEAEMAFRSFGYYKRLTVPSAEKAFEVAAGPVDLAHIFAEGFQKCGVYMLYVVHFNAMLQLAGIQDEKRALGKISRQVIG